MNIHNPETWPERDVELYEYSKYKGHPDFPDEVVRQARWKIEIRLFVKELRAIGAVDQADVAQYVIDNQKDMEVYYPVITHVDSIRNRETGRYFVGLLLWPQAYAQIMEELGVEYHDTDWFRDRNVIESDFEDDIPF